MASITIRKLDEARKASLRQRAAYNNRSMEKRLVAYFDKPHPMF